ncbi:hypothetical protein OE88DRAFT_1630420 [Heliocybe sulcata]|uniref:T6SS Phospholipase effector Tle1-like catalytic domain-containing protein n=1 Tax=Heliocybe sulcata TaxID=5364 RepID=A0A5C3N323_9AGAM|nr:hypothetical protein OE88DRAFT_1630420 [Heliocybe sulcata]
MNRLVWYCLRRRNALIFSRTELGHDVCSICRAKSNGRRLVIALDGTLNQFGLKYSNVVDIYRRITKDDQQITYYNSGIGTYANPSRRFSLKMFSTAIDSAVDLAIAWNFERIILEAYEWLSERYQEGDQIFLFGFSRGAYQVRVLAGMIERVGIIYPGNRAQMPFLCISLAVRSNSCLISDEDMSRSFKAKFSVTARVHFLGLWDTVSSVGIFRGKGFPLTHESEHVCYIRHALALDECRVKFPPEEYIRPGGEHEDHEKRARG